MTPLVLTGATVAPTKGMGALDLGFLRLPRPGSTYTGDEGIVGMIPELTDIAALSFHKNLVYYDRRRSSILRPRYGPVSTAAAAVHRRSGALQV